MTGLANHIGQRLQQEMKKRHMTSAALAKRAVVKTSFIYDLIRGKSANPSSVKLARVANALGVDLAYFVDGTQPTGHYAPIPHMAAHDLAEHKQDDNHFYFYKNWITEHLRAESGNLRALYVCGDSMHPTLLPNDFVLVDTSKKTPSPAGIFVLFDGQDFVPKRLEYTAYPPSERIRVISDNPQYSTYECSMVDISIIGRVVWFARII